MESINQYSDQPADYERLVESLENFVLDVVDGWHERDPGYRVARRKALAEALAAALIDGLGGGE